LLSPADGRFAIKALKIRQKGRRRPLPRSLLIPLVAEILPRLASIGKRRPEAPEKFFAPGFLFTILVCEESDDCETPVSVPYGIFARRATGRGGLRQVGYEIDVALQLGVVLSGLDAEARHR